MYENSSFWESIMPAEEDRGKGDKQNETATRMEASALPSLPDGNLIQQQPRELRERDAKDVCCTQIQGTPYIKYLCRNLENEEVTHACVMVKIAEEKPQKVGVSNRTVKENQKERSVYAPLDEMLDILISQGQNDYKPEQKQLLRLEDSLIFSENICSAVPMSEYNGASLH